MYQQSKNQFECQRTLASVIVQALPAVANVFKEFDGKRAQLKGGGTAAKLKTAVQIQDYHQRQLNKELRYIIVRPSVNSMWCGFYIQRHDLEKGIAHYSDAEVFMGSLDEWGVFKYNLDLHETLNDWIAVRMVDYDQLKVLRHEHNKLTSKVNQLESTVPYRVRKYLSCD